MIVTAHNIYNFVYTATGYPVSGQPDIRYNPILLLLLTVGVRSVVKGSSSTTGWSTVSTTIRGYINTGILRGTDVIQNASFLILCQWDRLSLSKRHSSVVNTSTFSSDVDPE